MSPARSARFVRLCVVAVLGAALLWHDARAGSELPNKVVVTAAAAVTFDRDTGLYTYAYTFTSTAQSVQQVDVVSIPLRGATIVNVRAPAGWDGVVFHDGSMVSWCACAEEGMVVPADFVDTGQTVPSVYQIKPGQHLSGFSYLSPDAPAVGTFYAGGFVLIPVEGVDFAEGESPELPTFPHDQFAGQTQAPLRAASSIGSGRSPASDAFLTLLTLKDGDSKTSPVLVDLVFGQNGETVYQQTFAAVLNGVDISDQFVATSGNRRRASLRLGPASALKAGVNVLHTTVDGWVPGASRITTDTEQIRFLAR